VHIDPHATPQPFDRGDTISSVGVIAETSCDKKPSANEGEVPTVFSQPAPFTLGNVSPLIAGLRNHHINNLDTSIFKVFTITEKVRLQFRAEAFNALNQVRFGGPNTTVTAGANFGRITTQSNDPRQMQFGLKLIW